MPGATSYTALSAGHSSVAGHWNRSLAGQVARWLVSNLIMLLPAALVMLRDAALGPRAGGLGRLAVLRVLAVPALTLGDLIPRDVRTSSRGIMACEALGPISLRKLASLPPIQPGYSRARRATPRRGRASRCATSAAAPSGSQVDILDACCILRYDAPILIWRNSHGG